MIPFLTEAGIRVIAPDLVGYGKSDKPAAREDYSYQNQVDWMGEWLKKNDFQNLTFFGQDWGGLIGLRMVAADPDRFIKIAMGNTGLPYNPNAPSPPPQTLALLSSFQFSFCHRFLGGEMANPDKS